MRRNSRTASSRVSRKEPTMGAFSSEKMAAVSTTEDPEEMFKEENKQMFNHKVVP